MKRVVAISEDLGVFLGTVSGYAIFSKDDPVGIPTAASFSSKEEAEHYFSENLPKTKRGLFFVEVESRNRYVSVVELIKAGHGQYTSEMLDLLPSPSHYFH